MFTRLCKRVFALFRLEIWLAPRLVFLELLALEKEIFLEIKTKMNDENSNKNRFYAKKFHSFLIFWVTAPNSPLHLSNRAHALLLLHRPQASLTDADHAVRLRPDWGKVSRVNIIYCKSMSLFLPGNNGDERNAGFCLNSFRTRSLYLRVFRGFSYCTFQSVH